MHFVSRRRSKNEERGRSKILMVSAGMALFIVGFVLVLAAMPQSNTVGSDSPSRSTNPAATGSGPSHEFYLLSGMFVSFTGVVLATVGPAVGFVKKSPKE